MMAGSSLFRLDLAFHENAILPMGSFELVLPSKMRT